MIRKQHIEWKEVWKDDYLEWLNGYANAWGGTLYIGKNDAGDVIGLENSRELLEDLPKKIKDETGIIADVNLREQNGKEYIEIVVQPHSPFVPYKGAYYFRAARG